MNRVLSWLADLVEHPSIKGLQALATLGGWGFGGTVLLLALLLWTDVIRVEPTLAQTDDATAADQRTAEAAMLRAQFALEHDARNRCTRREGAANELWAEGYVDVRDAIDQAERLQGLVDDVLQFTPGSTHTLGWRIAVGWRFADHVESDLDARADAEKAAIRHYACRALGDRAPLDVSIDSLVLTRLVLMVDDDSAGDALPAPEPADPCAARTELRAFVQAVSTAPATLDIVLPRDVRITGPRVPMLPAGEAEARGTRQLLVQAEAGLPPGEGCAPAPIPDAPEPVDPLPGLELANLAATLQGHGALLAEIHDAIVGDRTCAEEVQRTTAMRQAALAYGLGVAPDCTTGSRGGWVSVEPVVESAELAGVELRMRCADVCGDCATGTLPGDALTIQVQAAPFESCEAEAHGTAPPLFAQLGRRLSGEGLADGAPRYSGVEVVGWANHLTACEGTTNLGIAASRAEALADVIRSEAGDQADAVRVSAQVQDARSCDADEPARGTSLQQSHAAWRRVDLRLDGPGLAFAPEACAARR